MSSPITVRQLRSRTRDIARALKLVWGASPWLSFLWLALLAVQGLIPVGIVLETRQLVDELVPATRGAPSWESYRPALIAAVILGALFLAAEVLRSISDWARAVQSELIQDHIRDLIHKQSVALDLGYFESPEFHDRLNRARDDASSRPALLESLGSVLQNSITLVAMGGVLLPYGAWLPVLLFASTVPALAAVLANTRRQHSWWERVTQDRRRVQYFDRLLTDDLAAAEVRLFGLGSLFRERYRNGRSKLRSQRNRLLRNQAVSRLAAGSFALVVFSAVLVALAIRVAQGQLTLGDLALFYQAFHRGQNLMRGLLGQFGQIYNSSLFVGNLFEYLELNPRVEESPKPKLVSTIDRGIQLKNVSFAYPGSESPVLQNLNLEIPAGKVTAIVGENGAGKSTLLKLLGRFYDPGTGVVEVDGVDLRELSLTQWRERVSIMFQFPVLYQASARENIAIGDYERRDELGQIEAAARAAGAHDFIGNLPKRYDTVLGKWFDGGTELSAGQWQRIALARAFHRRSQLLVLDEPTSFMDSWSEAEWFRRFLPLAQGRTTVIITHRFSIARHADHIFVMRDGRIAESGTHQSLLESGGSYAQSWESQFRTASEDFEQDVASAVRDAEFQRS